MLRPSLLSILIFAFFCGMCAHARECGGRGRLVSSFLSPVSWEIQLENALEKEGYSRAFVQFILGNPPVRIREKGDSSPYRILPLFSLIQNDPLADVIAEIKRYFPPLCENDPEQSASVSFEEFLELQSGYREGTLSLKNNRLKGAVRPARSEVKPWEEWLGENPDPLRDAGLEAIAEGKVAAIIPGGGTSGRFFGYNVTIPESHKVKMLAPMWEVFGRKLSPCELKLMHYEYLRTFSGGVGVHLEVMGSGNNTEYLRQSIERFNLYPGTLVDFYSQFEIPRVNPTGEDLRAAKAASSGEFDPPSPDAAESERIWTEQNGNPGDIFQNDDGTYTGKPPGHFDVVARLILSRKLFDLVRRGVKVLHIGNGDDVGALVDPAKVAHLLSHPELDMLNLMIRIQSGEKKSGGFWLNVDGHDQIVESHALSENSDASFVRHFSTGSMYLKTDSLLRLFDIRAEEMDSIPQDVLMRKVRAVTSRLKTYVEVKPVQTAEGRVRPAAQFMRMLGDITAFLNAQAIEIDANGAESSDAYFSIKSPEDADQRGPSVLRFLGLGAQARLRFPENYFPNRTRFEAVPPLSALSASA